jgi:hypothetical protein
MKQLNKIFHLSFINLDLPYSSKQKVFTTDMFSSNFGEILGELRTHPSLLSVRKCLHGT